MLIGYARTSTIEQEAGFAAQLVELKAAGCEDIYQEQVSSVDVVAREQLAAALKFARKGDTLVVTKLDRLARNMVHLMQVVAKLNAKGVELRILAMGIDTNTDVGKLMLSVLGGVAEFERNIMLTRQREGIAKAKADGKYKGRAPTARAKSAEVLELRAAGLGKSEIARRLGIDRKSVYSILAAPKPAA